MINKVIKSLNAQAKRGTLERNTVIALRALAGEPQVALAQEFGVTKQLINRLVKRYRRNQVLSKALAGKD